MTETEIKKRDKMIRRVHAKLLRKSAPAEDGHVLVEPKEDDVQEELERLNGYKFRKDEFDGLGV